MLKRSRMLAILLIMIACAFASPAQQRSVAITFDDLPAAGTTDPTEVKSLNISILDSLDRHHTPAIGFIIESRVQEIGKAGMEIFEEWINRGYELGNHTFSHADFNGLIVDEFEKEIMAGESSLTAAMAKVGKTPRYFRFPQNHTGDTKEKHDAIAAFLQRRGYTLAVCTIDNEDFAFNEAYLKMFANKDEESASRLRADYLAYTSTEIDYYTELHRKIFSREIPHVMLLHVNRLNADVIDKLLDIFEQKRYAFVSLDTALADPAYKTPDADITKYGPMWGYRWARELGIKVNGALETEPPAWIAQYDKENQK
jgi:peptidoglycan/xylan/chitin deacetylase (PgdA/CDA1 family)